MLPTQGVGAPFLPVATEEDWPFKECREPAWLRDPGQLTKVPQNREAGAEQSWVPSSRGYSDLL